MNSLFPELFIFCLVADGFAYGRLRYHVDDYSFLIFCTITEKEKEENLSIFLFSLGCGGITDYRTFMNDFRKCAEFVRWLKEKAEG